MVLDKSVPSFGDRMNETADRSPTWMSDSVLPLLCYAAVSLAMVGPFVLPATQIDTTSYDFHDSFIFMWNFWWMKEAVGSGYSPLRTDAIFYPEGTSLAFHSYPLPYSLATIPVQFLSPGLDGLATSFNLIVFASFVLSGFGAYRLALFVTGSRAGAMVAGLVYAFMPFHLLNAARLHVVALEFLPFYVLALLRLEASPNFRNAFRLGLWLALNYYTSLEYALYLVLFSFVRLAWLVLVERGVLTRDYFSRLVFAAFCFILVAGPLIYEQARVYWLSGGQTIVCPVDEAIAWSPAVASWVTPSRGHPLYGDLFAFAGSYRDGRTTGMRSETALNFTTLVLAAIGCWGSARDRRWFWVLAFLAFLILSLGPYLRVTGTWMTKVPMPWLALYEMLPPFRGGREPARFFPLAMLMITLPAALGVRGLCRATTNPRSALAITAVAALFVLFEDLIRWPVERIEPKVHPFYERLASETGDFAIMDLTPESNKLLAQPVHQRKSVEWRSFVVRSEQIDKITPFWLLNAEFEQPQQSRGLPPLGHEQIAQYQQLLADTRVRYIVFSKEGAPARVQLAQRLGAEVSVEEALVICRFSH